MKKIIKTFLTVIYGIASALSFWYQLLLSFVIPLLLGLSYNPNVLVGHFSGSLILKAMIFYSLCGILWTTKEFWSQAFEKILEKQEETS